jgi:hypothetical protein
MEATGLNLDDQVIDNPPDALRAGGSVKPSAEPEASRKKE